MTDTEQRELSDRLKIQMEQVRNSLNLTDKETSDFVEDFIERKVTHPKFEHIWKDDEPYIPQNGDL